jgi:hypothetical protein
MSDDEIKKAIDKSSAGRQAAHPKERAAFRTLLLSNPNYFGNLEKSPLKPVLPIKGNTHYESIGCVGYHPQLRRLEGVVYVYQPTGYGGGVCSPGTPEYVRFYLSYDHGATWQDQGLTSFQAYDVPEATSGTKRLEYAVSLPVAPTRKLCTRYPLIRARAILSWNNPPPANQPNWSPIWGNVRDATILVEPRRSLITPDLLALAAAKLPPELHDLVDLEAPIPLKTKELALTELATLYERKPVPVHRFAFKELVAFATGPAAVSAEDFAKINPNVFIDPSVIGPLLHPTDGDTSFEELTCIGLDPNAPDTLAGVIHVKKSSGYSGGPCTLGSQEHVTFWGDFDGDGGFETCLGTASVRVYDIDDLPPDGVHYAVRLPVDLTQYRRGCREGARVVRIRAILSWNVALGCADPDVIPTWGNREETLINIPAVVQEPAGRMAIIGGIPVSMIGANGMTTPAAVFATNNVAPDALGRPCPFGGRVTVQGAPVVGDEYLVEVSPDGVIWTPVLTDLVVTDQFGNTSPHKANPVTKRFDYLPFTSNVNGVLAHWDSGGDALWRVRLTVFNTLGVPQGSADVRVVQLDNTGPDADVTITTGLGDCGKFGIGTVLQGKFVARDTHLGSWSLGVAPGVNPPGVGVPAPTGGLVDTSPLPGDDWSLDTAGMRPCGYVLSVVVTDRTIVNSQGVGHTTAASVGFCLEAATDA